MSNCTWCGRHDEDPEDHYRYWHLAFGSPLLRTELPRRAVDPAASPKDDPR